MRSMLLFVAGVLVGVAAQATLAQNGQSQVQMMNHVGINVPNIPEAITYYNAAISQFKQRGVTVSEPNVSASTKAILANITDPYMGRIELAEITPDSLHRKALDSWK